MASVAFQWSMRLKVAAYMGAGLFVLRAPALYLGYQEKHQGEAKSSGAVRQQILPIPEDRVEVPKEMYTKLLR